MNDKRTLKLRRLTRKWELKPSAFVEEVFRVQLRPKQVEAIDSFATGNPRARVAWHGYRGAGKTALLAWYAIYFATLYKDAVIVLLSASWLQLREILFPELSYWYQVAGRNGWPLGMAPKRTMWEPRPGTRAIGVSPREPGKIQGFHARDGGAILLIVDEPSGVADPIYEATHGYDTRASICHRLAAGIPGRDVGWFYKAVHSQQWRAIHADGETDTACDPAWRAERLADWSRSHALYTSEVRGLFYAASDFGLCDPVWLRLARNGGGDEVVRTGDSQLGWDVGAGGDLNAGYARLGGMCVATTTQNKKNTVETKGDIIAFGRETGTKLWVVDEGGIGLHLVNDLKNDGHPVVGYNAANAARDKEHYKPRRAEDAWGLRDRFEQGRIDLAKCDEGYFKRLEFQACSLGWKRNGSGQTVIEGKAEYKDRMSRERGGQFARSPDEFDACMMAHAVMRAEKVTYKESASVGSVKRE